MANNKQQIQILWTNSINNPPVATELVNGQPVINIRKSIETLYFKNEAGDGLIEFIPKDQIKDLIYEIIGSGTGGTMANVIGENGINVDEITDADGKRTISISIKLDSDISNKASANTNGLFVSNVTDCGVF